MSLAEWQAKGRDVKSIVADPRCADPVAGDFRLGESSPAETIGFEAIDLKAGLEGPPAWVEAPRKIRRDAGRPGEPAPGR